MPRRKGGPRFGDNPDRDAQGHFKPGHSVKSPGNPHWRKIAEHRKAIKEAISPKDIKDVIQKMRDMAKEGDVFAARVFLERCVGKPGNDPFGEGLGFKIPDITSLDDLKKVTQMLLAAALAGTSPVEEIERVANVVEKVRSVFETDLREELDALKATVDTILQERRFGGPA